MKQKLYIQTKEEYEKPQYSIWAMEQEGTKEQKRKLREEIKRLQEEIAEKRRQIRNCKVVSFSIWKKEHSYSDFVNDIRKRHSDDYIIVENDDSLLCPSDY